MAKVKNTKTDAVKKPKERRSFIVIFSAVVLCACLAISFFTKVKDIKEVENQIAAVDSVKAETDAENNALKDKINDGDKDKYVEEIARDKLGYIMPGEKVYQDVSVND